MSDKSLMPTDNGQSQQVSPSFKRGKDLDPEVLKENRRGWLWVVILLIFALVLSFGVFVSWYLSAFEATSLEKPMMLLKKIQTGMELDPYEESSVQTILILGVDSIAEQREASLLTDTMMLVALHSSGEARILPIPRDLWIESLQTKVNALYYYGEQDSAGEGELLVTQVLKEIADIQVDNTLVVKTQDVIEIIDLLGGIEVDVAHSFVDESFPRTDVDPTSEDENELYMTVSFEKGLQHMDGDRALIFMRSRHSNDEAEGTDLARQDRQQLVLTSLMQRMTDISFILQPGVLGSLYNFYSVSLDTSLSIEEIVGLLSHTDIKSAQVSQQTIPVTDDERMGILYHPTQFKNSQWVYLPYDRSYDELTSYIHSSLYEKN